MSEASQEPGANSANGIAAERLKAFVERIERLESERTELNGDIKEVYSEASGCGFDKKIMRQVIRLRKMESADRREQDELIELYRRALDI